jgi:NAD(P)H-dependent FMN reductase
MKVVAFNGSARKNGNTAILVNRVFQELQKEGIEIELVQPWLRFAEVEASCIQFHKPFLLYRSDDCPRFDLLEHGVWSG